MFRKLFLLLAIGASAYYFSHTHVQQKTEINDDEIFATMYLDCNN